MNLYTTRRFHLTAKIKCFIIHFSIVYKIKLNPQVRGIDQLNQDLFQKQWGFKKFLLHILG